MYPQSTALDPTLHSPRVLEIKRKLLARTIGQDQAVNKFAAILETFFAGYSDPTKPVSVVLELGPTGTGKTSLVENLCDILYGDPKGHIRVNCADFSDNHQVPPSCRTQKLLARTRPAQSSAAPALCGPASVTINKPDRHSLVPLSSGWP